MSRLLTHMDQVVTGTVYRAVSDDGCEPHLEPVSVLGRPNRLNPSEVAASRALRRIGLTYFAIGDALGCSEGAVRSALNAAKPGQ